MRKEGFGKLASLTEAISVLESIVKKKGCESVLVLESLGRTLGKDVIAPLNVPEFEKSAMDGFAVIAKDTFVASQTKPITMLCTDSITAGVISQKVLEEGTCIEITTGAPVPKGADAVVMVEHTETESNKITIYKGLAPGDNIIKIGSDIKKDSLVVKKGTRIDARIIGVLSALGITNIPVVIKPIIAYFSTGNEITPLGKPLEPGKIYDINSATIINAVKEQDCEVLDLGLIPDDLDAICKAIKEGTEKSDFLILSGGSSLGGEDFMLEAVAKMGEVHIHGIAVKPGKPVLIGTVNKTLVLGLPGYPTSALSNFYILVVPLINSIFGRATNINFVEAKLSRKISSTIGRYEFLAVKTEESNGELIATPVMKGSSSITTLAEANGFLEIDENTEVVNKNDSVRVRRF